MRVCIIDCYIDEPAGLGVPPYLGTTPRYVFGAVRIAGSEPSYISIDDVRNVWGRSHDRIILTHSTEETSRILRRSDLIVVLGGSHTPGKYLRGRPGVPKEIKRIVESSSTKVFVGGPVAEGTMAGGRALPVNASALGDPDGIIYGDPELFVHRFLTSGSFSSLVYERSYDELDRFALAGAGILDKIKVGPDLVCEIETSRGCARALTGGCSFCSECSRFGLPVYREASSVVSEVQALKARGAMNIRIGRQSCFFSYKAEGVGEVETPTPNPKAIDSLLSACSAIGLNSLHIDNVNPAVLAEHPRESRLIIKSLVKHCTPGNVAALGIETADPKVVRRNNLKALPQNSLEAIRLLNEHGSRVGWNGQHYLLPGINFVLGLPGETKETYELNRTFLEGVLEENLLLRRINIRRVIPVKGTPLWGKRWPQKPMARHSRGFIEWVRFNVDRPMLRRVYPHGRVLKGLVAEVQKGNTAFCRFPGSYPVVVGVYGRFPPGTVLEGVVVGHGFRSLTALEFPVDINSCSGRSLEIFPEIGPARSARIIRSRPINSRSDLQRAMEPDPPSKEGMDLISQATKLC